MADPMEDVTRAFERFNASARRARDAMARYVGMRERIAEAVAHSADHGVAGVAGPGGAIKDIRFTADALRQRPQALRGAVLSTLRAAVADAARTAEVPATSWGLVGQPLGWTA
ncbi:hypothetical protein [Gandjariella thermophila]|uniref:Uncharacterized protein n=1 Tax=Gandjariella thermophila TaxID=1931992 RepID=A0A4D4J8A6_9PSEU|nr:hypothetical protein [Gandjariella thermophila]GDY30669.1 hypothetical protein GTS_23020 [Gandjariella thermophila]